MQKIKCPLAFLVVLIFISYTLSYHGYAATEFDARLAISTSEERVVGCYRTALEAEKIGVNISSLLAPLNGAGFFLSRAHTYYKVGNYSGAIYYAKLVSESLVAFDEQVKNLVSSAVFPYEWRFRHAVIYAVLRVFIVILVGFLSWLYVKGRYIQMVLKMKPEINER